MNSLKEILLSIGSTHVEMHTDFGATGMDLPEVECEEDSEECSLSCEDKHTEVVYSKVQAWQWDEVAGSLLILCENGMILFDRIILK